MICSSGGTSNCSCGKAGDENPRTIPKPRDVRQAVRVHAATIHTRAFLEGASGEHPDKVKDCEGVKSATPLHVFNPYSVELSDKRSMATCNSVVHCAIQSIPAMAIYMGTFSGYNNSIKKTISMLFQTLLGQCLNSVA